MRLLQQTNPQQRSQLFRPLAEAWVSLSLSPLDSVGPVAQHYTRDPLTLAQPLPAEANYDSAQALGEAIDWHTLNGLGPDERRQFLAVDQTTRPPTKALWRAGRRLMRSLLPGYRLNTDELLQGTDWSNRTVTDLARLGNFRYPGFANAFTGEQKQMAIRHQELMSWLADSHVRYGDTDS